VTGLGPERVGPLLRGRLGRPYVHVAECETTQLLLPDDAPEGAVATADHQRAGRGRQGRRWEDEPGSALLVSLVLRPPPGAPVPQLSLVCALAVAETVERAAAVAAHVKWPNDVLVEGRKVAGILAELRAGSGAAELVLGFGVNVGTPPTGYPPDLAPATSLSAAVGRTVGVDDTAAALLASLDGWIACLRRGGWEEVREAFVRYAPGVEGARVTLRGGATGITRGLDATGALLVETAQGDVPVHAGESLASWEA